MGSVLQQSPKACQPAFAWLTELLALDIHSLTQVVLDARFENDFKDNYKELKTAFERLKILKFLDRQRLMSSGSPHASVLSWLYNRYKDTPPRPGFDPGVQQGIARKYQQTAGPSKLDADPPVAKGTAACTFGTCSSPKVPRLELSRLTAGRISEESTLPAPKSPAKWHRGFLASRRQTKPELAEPEEVMGSSPSERGDNLVFKPSPTRILPLKTPRLFPGGSSNQARQASGDEGAAMKELKQKLAHNSKVDMTQLQSHPIAVTPKATPPGSPQACWVHERKAGFSHGRIPPNDLMGPQAKHAQEARDLGSSTALPTSARAAGANVADCIPWLMAIGTTQAPLAPKAHAAAAAASAPPPASTSAVVGAPQGAPAGGPAERVQQGAMLALPSRAAAATPPRERRAAAAEATRNRSPGPRTAAPVAAAPLLRQRSDKALMDSASSLSGRGRTLRRTCDPAEVEAADLAAQSAAVTVLKALPELQLMLKDFGSANRDGYLHRGKMRCRRWMIGTLIPQTRELLQHVRKLSQLAGDEDAAARARARRARRSLKELHEAEGAFKDVCDQIAKAERFFPVPGSSGGSATCTPPRAQGGARQLEVSLKGIGQAMAELQTIWAKIAPSSSWVKSSKSPPPAGRAAEMPAQRSPPSSDDEASSEEGGYDQSLEMTAAVQELAIIPRPCHEASVTDQELSEPEDLYDLSADELDETAANRAAVGLRSRSMARLALGAPGRDAIPERRRFNAAGESSWETPVGPSPGVERSGSVAYWVTFDSSPAATPPRSPLHDAWATPSAVSPLSAGAHVGEPCGGARGTMRRLQLEPTVPANVEEQAALQEDGVLAVSQKAATGTSLQPDPIQPHGNLEQPVLPRSALYVPGNPSLLAAEDSRGNTAPRGSNKAEGGKDASVQVSASSADRPPIKAEESSGASRTAGRALSIKDRIAALESQNPQGPEPVAKKAQAKAGSLDSRQAKPTASTVNSLQTKPTAPPVVGQEIKPAAPPVDSRQIKPAASPIDTGREMIGPDAQCTVIGKASEEAPAGSKKALPAPKLKDGEIGTETFPDCMYVGAFQGGMRDGLGVCHYMNGDYYEGEWQAGLRHGRGMQQCADGSNYVGDYVNGQREGYGVYVFPNGDRYEGECSGDLPDGHGVYRFQVSGAVCEGAWRAGAKHGYFIITVGCKQSCGRWENGELRFMSEVSSPTGASMALPEGSDDAELSTPSLAMEAARAARAAAEHAGQLPDDHWSSLGPMQKAIQAILLGSQLPKEIELSA